MIKKNNFMKKESDKSSLFILIFMAFCIAAISVVVFVCGNITGAVTALVTGTCCFLGLFISFLIRKNTALGKELLGLSKSSKKQLGVIVISSALLTIIAIILLVVTMKVKTP